MVIVIADDWRSDGIKLEAEAEVPSSSQAVSPILCVILREHHC